MTRDFELKRGCKVFVTALDEEGLPVEGVTVYPSYAGTGLLHESKEPFLTDPNGMVDIGGLSFGTYLLIAAHRDYAVVGDSVKFIESQGAQSIVLILEAGLDVGGLSTCSDGLLADGWEIRVLPTWCHSRLTQTRGARVTEDGTFLLRHILPGPHRLELWSTRFHQSIWSKQVTLPPSDGWLDLFIPIPSSGASASLSGKVSFVGNDFPGRFTIFAEGHSGYFDSTPMEPGERAFAFTDLLPDLYDLSVVIDGRRTEFTNIRAPSEDVVLEIPVEAPWTLRGRVIDSKTALPITQFKVQEGREDEWQRITDPEGAFEIMCRGSACRHVRVRAERFGEAESNQVCPTDQSATVVALRRPLKFRGRIVDARGQALEGVAAHYWYRWREKRFDGERKRVYSDVRGRFEMTLGSTSEIEAFFMFQHPDYASLVRHLTIPDNPHDEVPIVMSAGGAVEGRVHDWQGNPLANTQLFWSLAADYRGAGSDEDPLARVVTDDGGFYHVEHLPTEHCFVHLDRRFRRLGVTMATILPAEGQTRRLDLGGSWCVSGRLLANGEPLVYAELVASPSKGLEVYTKTDHTGAFRFFGLPTGQTSLYCNVEGEWGGWTRTKLGDYFVTEGRDQALGEFDLSLAEVLYP